MSKSKGLLRSKHKQILEILAKHDQPITAKQVKAWIDWDGIEVDYALTSLFHRGLIGKQGKKGTSNLYSVSQLGRTFVSDVQVTIHVPEHVNLERIR